MGTMRLKSCDKRNAVGLKSEKTYTGLKVSQACPAGCLDFFWCLKSQKPKADKAAFSDAYGQVAAQGLAQR